MAEVKELYRWWFRYKRPAELVPVEVIGETPRSYGIEVNTVRGEAWINKRTMKRSHDRYFRSKDEAIAWRIAEAEAEVKKRTAALLKAKDELEAAIRYRAKEGAHAA